MTIIDNIINVESAINNVKNHHMCANFREDDTYYYVIFPLGDFEVDGIRASKVVGKYVALSIMLTHMDNYWKRSFPTHR